MANAPLFYYVFLNQWMYNGSCYVHIILPLSLYVCMGPLEPLIIENMISMAAV